MMTSWGRNACDAGQRSFECFGPANDVGDQVSMVGESVDIAGRQTAPRAER